MQNWIHACRSGLAQMLMVTLVLLTIANPAWANDPVATDAIRALRALNAATSAGVNQAEYQRRLIDTKVLVDEYLETSDAGKSEIRLIIGRSMRLYELAGQAWGDQIEGARRDIPGDIRVAIFGRLVSETAGSTRAACLPLRKQVSDGLQNARRHPDWTTVPPGYGIGLVPLIWECAGDEVKAASALARRGATR